jgi:hypothetical protein
MVPSFDPVSGYLPRGVHPWTWADFSNGFTWTQRRRFLIGGLYRALRNLKGAGCRSAIVDGSYVTAKDSPGDYDAAFDPNGVDGRLVDPVLLRHSDGRKSMRAKYFGDMVPWGAVACEATGMIYQDFFQQDRDGRAKGVVLLDVRALP